MSSGFSLVSTVLSVVYICLAIAVAIYANRMFKSLPFGLWGDVGIAAVAIAAFALFLGNGWYRLLIELDDDYPRYFALAYMPFVAFVAIAFARSLVPFTPSRAIQSPALAMAGPDMNAPIPSAPLPGAAISTPSSLGGSGPGSAGPGPAVLDAKPQFPLMKWLKLGLAAVLLVMVALILVGKFVTRNDLPGCNGQTTKDILSDIFKGRKIEVKRYDDFKTNSTSESEITCTAFMTMMDNHKGEIDYSIHFNADKNVEVRIIAGRDK